MPILAPPSPKEASPGCRELIREVYEADPLTCPACGAETKLIGVITDYVVIDKIIYHLGIAFGAKRPAPPARQGELY
jgi:hypothetical protein